MRNQTFITGVATAALLSGPALAQEAEGQVQEGQESQLAEQCYEDLRTFGQRIQEEGYWLTGVRGRWGGTAGTAYPGVGAPGGAMPGAVEAPAADPEAAAADDPLTNDPLWGVGIHSPGVQIETLFRGAQILAIRGDQQGCEAVLSELTQLYDEYATTLQEAGVDPDQVTTWRQEMMATAQPVTELPADRISVDRITETQVRNMQDEYLGDIEDLQISDGQVEHVIISRGGFLGLGEDYRVVPWDVLRTTPNMNLFLLDVPEEALEQAPSVAGGSIGELTDEQRAQISQYWEQQGATTAD